MPIFTRFNGITGPKPRQEVAHAVDDGAPISGNGGTRTLFAKAHGKTIQVKAQTLRGLQVAEGVIHEVKRDCVPANGNQITDVQRTNGWSYLLSQAYRFRDRKDPTLLNDADRTRAAIELQAGTCTTNAVCSYVLTQAKVRNLAPDDPLRSRPLHLISDNKGDHSYVVWGERADGGKGKFADEAIVIDAWTGLPKPYLVKELGKEKQVLDATPSRGWTAEPGNGQAFDLEQEKAAARAPERVDAAKLYIEKYLDVRQDAGTAPGNVAEVREHLRNTEGMPTTGPDLLDWATDEHKNRKKYLDDRVTFIGRPDTRYIDKDGNHGTFDRLHPRYVQDFAQHHATASNGKLGEILRQDAIEQARQAELTRQAEKAAKAR
jgi:hypothetical protein